MKNHWSGPTRRAVGAVVLLTLAAIHGVAADRLQPRAAETILLDIPPRQQWREFNGYCGECSIQQAALFYGTYVSEYVCRAIVDPSQQQEVLVAVNEDRVLSALRLQYEQFPYRAARRPQFQAYMVWIKQHLRAGHPALIVAYDQEGDDPDYDHIMLAVGCTSRDFNAYRDDDTLFFNDCFGAVTQRRPFRWLPDTRFMQGNGQFFEFCVPYRIDYGCAVTGIEDNSDAALPVQIFVDRPREPNIPLGQPPVLLSATVTVTGLTPGSSYALYRYNDYHHVPTQNYAASQFDTVEHFVASAAEATFPDSILSDGVAIYRCLPEGQ